MAFGLKERRIHLFCQNALRLVIGSAVVTALIGHSITFQVHEGQAAVVTRFAKPVRVADTAGLHFKAPWPMAKAIPIDVRDRVLTTPQTELLTRDKTNIVLTTSVTWRVMDPIQFHRSVRSIENAEEKLQGLVTNANIATFGQYDLNALVSTDATTLNIDAIEQDVLLAANGVARPRYGIEAETLGFRRVSLPAQNIPFVLEQMRTERQQFAARFRAQGALEAERIRSAADLEAARLIAEAKEAATRLLGQVDAETAQIYAQAHATAPEFFAFIRSLESLEKIVGENARLTLRTDVAPFSLLKNAPKVEVPQNGTTGHSLTRLLGAGE